MQRTQSTTMGEGNEICSAPQTPRPERATLSPFPVSCPPSQLHSSSFSRSPLLDPELVEAAAKNRTPRTPRTPRIISPTPKFISPLTTPLRNAFHLTKFDPQDNWLPLTESRNGNKYYAAFHTLSSGIGIQALMLPVAFTFLGWTWGIISLTIIFMWQLYTLWILVQLHESMETGYRYSRYLQLSVAAFGERVGKLLVTVPIIYLSGGTCTALVIVGGSAFKVLFQTICGSTCRAKPLTTVEWYLVFTCAAVVLSQLPNLNSIAGVSLLGAVTAVGYCTLIWVVSVSAGRLPEVSYDLVVNKSEIASILNAIGIVAFAFRGHNLILEIQGTMPSSEKHPSHVPMWEGVRVAYMLIALCLFPLAIGGYWAYGQKIPTENGVLTALDLYHSHDVSRSVLGLISILVIINALSSFQIYGMPAFDDLESLYTSRKKRPCPRWLRALLRTVFGFLNFFSAVAIPFLGSLAGLVGSVALPVTLAYPCFMWVKMKKPERFSGMWWLNCGLGVLGMGMSGVLGATALYVLIQTGVKISFFNPQ